MLYAITTEEGVVLQSGFGVSQPSPEDGQRVVVLEPVQYEEVLRRSGIITLDKNGSIKKIEPYPAREELLPGLVLPRAKELPAAEEQYRGYIVFLEGTPDRIYCCVQLDRGSYEWMPLWPRP